MASVTVFGNVAQCFLQNAEEAERDLVLDLLREDICATALDEDPASTRELPTISSDSQRKPQQIKDGGVELMRNLSDFGYYF
jgi:hypothetical protein